MCMVCWMKKVASDCCKLRGEAMQSHARSLAELWEKQGGVCALTGTTLVPGVNASLDHIVPKAKGGTNALDNLQWVCIPANQAKSDLSTEEFVDLCRRVVAKFG